MQNYYSSITGRSISHRIFLILVIGVIFQLTSCEAIFERNISSDSMTLIMPTNNDTASSNNIYFKWEELKGASHYNLQIVQPSFASIDAFILDSNIESTQFTFILPPGDYQFKIRAENSAYESLWTGPYNLVVDSVSDLTNQIVPLISPADAIYCNGDNFTFVWQSIYAAETYEYQLKSGADFLSSGTILHGASGIYGTVYTPPAGLLAIEGSYSWGVRASNQTSSSGFSSRSILVDLTLPNSPVSLYPSNGASFDDTVVFKWGVGADVGTVQSPVSGTLEIATDTVFTSVLHSYTVSEDTLQHVFSVPGNYWWRVKTLDQAGNISTNYSVHRKVIITP